MNTDASRKLQGRTWQNRQKSKINTTKATNATRQAPLPWTSACCQPWALKSPPDLGRETKGEADLEETHLTWKMGSAAALCAIRKTSGLALGFGFCFCFGTLTNPGSFAIQLCLKLMGAWAFQALPLATFHEAPVSSLSMK